MLSLVIIPGQNATDYANRHKFHEKDKNEQIKLLKNRKKIAIVREPMLRIFSAYRSKIQPDTNNYFGSISKRWVINCFFVCLFKEFQKNFEKIKMTNRNEQRLSKNFWNILSIKTKLWMKSGWLLKKYWIHVNMNTISF